MNTNQDFPTGDLQLQLSSTNPVSASVSHEAPRGNPTKGGCSTREPRSTPMNPSGESNPGNPSTNPRAKQFVTALHHVATLVRPEAPTP